MRARSVSVPAVGVAPGTAITASYIVDFVNSLWSYVDTSVSFYLSTDATITTADLKLASISVRLYLNQTTSRTQTLTIPSETLLGRYYLGVIVDPNNAIAETSETNNAVASAAFTVGPDLDVVVVIPPDSLPAITQGGSFDIVDLVENHGSAAGASVVRLYLSPDSVITAADTLLGSRSVPAVGGGSSSAGTTRVKLPASVAGPMYVGAIADATGLVAEAKETNNTSPAEALTIQPATGDPCGCSAGVCALVRSRTTYCYDGAGNVTARFIALVGASCAPPVCP